MFISIREADITVLEVDLNAKAGKPNSESTVEGTLKEQRDIVEYVCKYIFVLQISSHV